VDCRPRPTTRPDGDEGRRSPDDPPRNSPQKLGRAPHQQSNQLTMHTRGIQSLPRLLPGMLPRLWTFALRLSGDRHDAEDLLQRACVRGLERAHQLQPGTAPLSWMFSIVQSMWINELRARNVRSRSGLEWNDNFLLTVADPAVRTPEETLLNGEIIAAVERLPEPQRNVMLLVAVEGLSYAEAAAMLDVPIGTIMSRLSRARQTVAAHFDGSDAPAKRLREEGSAIASIEE